RLAHPPHRINRAWSPLRDPLSRSTSCPGSRRFWCATMSSAQEKLSLDPQDLTPPRLAALRPPSRAGSGQDPPLAELHPGGGAGAAPGAVDGQPGSHAEGGRGEPGLPLALSECSGRDRKSVV